MKRNSVCIIVVVMNVWDEWMQQKDNYIFCNTISE